MSTQLVALGGKSNAFTPHLNTGTVFDVATGAFVPGMDGNAILNGGLSRLNGIVGRPQMYKSAEALSLATRALSRYKDSMMVCHDSEFTISGPQRLIDLSGDPNLDEDRIVLYDNAELDTAGVLLKIQEIAKEKQSRPKDFMVETPFVDRKTMKPIKMFIPTIFAIDSISKLGLAKEEELYEKHHLGDSKLNTVYMQDGNAKTQLMRQLPAIAAKAGIYFVITAHIGNKFDLDPYAKSPKDLQHMKGNDTIKGAGSQFTFLTSALFETRKVTTLVDSNKKCMYPPQYQSNNHGEINQVDTVVVRCKNNASGTIVSPIISQHEGILDGVTNYHFLKKHNMFGLDGNVRSQSIKWLPDVSIERTNVRTKLADNYELDRALEILAHLCYIKNYWSMYGLQDFGFEIRPSDFVNNVLKGGKGVMSDILNSRGYWTYDKDDPRKYMSIKDIIDLLNGKNVKAK